MSKYPLSQWRRLMIGLIASSIQTLHFSVLHSLSQIVNLFNNSDQRFSTLFVLYILSCFFAVRYNSFYFVYYAWTSYSQYFFLAFRLWVISGFFFLHASFNSLIILSKIIPLRFFFGECRYQCFCAISLILGESIILFLVYTCLFTRYNSRGSRFCLNQRDSSDHKTSAFSSLVIIIHIPNEA